METIFSEYISPFLLAILQGISEFLPISSSGHLVLLNSVMTTDAGLLFDLVLHLATLISVVVFYRKAIADICVGCVKEIAAPIPKTNLKFVGYLIVATIITGIIGLALNDAVAKLMADGVLAENPIRRQIAAVSVGVCAGKPTLDLDYAHDSTAEVDFNVIMTDKGKFVELQGCAEHKPFGDKDLAAMLALAKKGLKKLFALQKKALGR